MSVDSIGDFLTVIRNATMISKPIIVVPYSKIKFAIAQILKNEGFVKDVVVLDDKDPQKELKLFLKYVDGESVIHEIKRVSKLGRRFYTGAKDIKPVIGGLGLSIVSTSRGVISHQKAKQLNVGGEIICTVW
ncbi:MAG: 30S ribosomal protein S8 [Candidatus Babeliales bacterium]|jgi:small subunit ribosomal protein S8